MSEDFPKPEGLADRTQWLDYRVANEPQTYDAYHNGAPLFEHTDRHGEPVATDDPVVQVLSEKMSQNYRQLEGRLRHNLEDGRQLGFVPDEVDQQRLDAVFWTASVNVVSKGALKGGVGEYDPVEDKAYVEAGSPLGESNRVLTHEIRHRLSGGTFRNYGEGGVWRERTGFGQHDRHEALDEAINEHVTQALVHGEWHALNPRERSQGKGAYPLEREALAVLIDRSAGHIKLETLVRASFEDTTAEGGVSERRQMMRETNEAYEHGTWHKFDRMMKMVNQLKEQGVHMFSEHLPIVPPTFDEHGKMIKKGYIDLKPLRAKLKNPKQVTGDPLH